MLAKAGASLRFDFARVIALGAAAVSAARLPRRASAILFYLLLLQGRACCVERLPFLLAVREADLGVGGLGVGAAALAAALRVGGEYDCAPSFRSGRSTSILEAPERHLTDVAKPLRQRRRH